MVLLSFSPSPEVITFEAGLSNGGVRRPRVACFTPLSPVPSGISFYSEELLPVLARAVDLEVFVDGYTPTPAGTLAAAGVRVRDAR